MLDPWRERRATLSNFPAKTRRRERAGTHIHAIVLSAQRVNQKCTTMRRDRECGTRTGARRVGPGRLASDFASPLRQHGPFEPINAGARLTGS
jgi:hypothetical protein